jgi:TIR domain
MSTRNVAEAAFVPGFENDVFVSYAHEDDMRWVQAFTEELRDVVSRRLGLPISIWEDTERIRAGANWHDAIQTGIDKSAAFVAIVSPRYQNSKWCARERTEFLRQFKGKFETNGRFFKVVKTPWPDDGQKLFLEAIQDVDFFKTDDDGPREFTPGSKEFKRAVRLVAEGLVQLLRTMRHGNQRVHVAWPPEECLREWEQLKDELCSRGFDVQPTGPRDSSFAERLLLQDMENAVVSVHLFGATYDAFAERVAILAAGLNRQIVFWLSNSAEATPDERQRNLIAAIKSGVRPDGTKLEWPAGWSLIPDTGGRVLVDAVVSKLRPVATAPSASKGATGSSIYIVHDPKTAEDAKVALELKDQIGRTEKMEVFTSRGDFGSPTELRLWHEQRLQTCDGVLLYRNAAPDGWWDQLAPEIVLAERRMEREPIKSRAFLLPKAPAWDVGPNVKIIPYSAPFQLASLEPFLEPLRR